MGHLISYEANMAELVGNKQELLDAMKSQETYRHATNSHDMEQMVLNGFSGLNVSITDEDLKWVAWMLWDYYASQGMLEEGVEDTW